MIESHKSQIKNITIYEIRFNQYQIYQKNKTNNTIIPVSKTISSIIQSAGGAFGDDGRELNEGFDEGDGKNGTSKVTTSTKLKSPIP